MGEESVLERVGGPEIAIQLVVDVQQAMPDFVPVVTIGIPHGSTIDQVKDALVTQGVFIPKQKMKLSHERIGVLNAKRSLAFYNFENQAHLLLTIKQRAGA